MAEHQHHLHLDALDGHIQAIYHNSQAIHHGFTKLISSCAENTLLLRKILNLLPPLPQNEQPSEQPADLLVSTEIDKIEIIVDADVAQMPTQPDSTADEELASDFGLVQGEPFHFQSEQPNAMRSCPFSESVNVSIALVVQPTESYVDDIASQEQLPHVLRSGSLVSDTDNFGDSGHFHTQSGLVISEHGFDPGGKQSGHLAAAQVFATMPKRIDFVPPAISTLMAAEPVRATHALIPKSHPSSVFRWYEASSICSFATFEFTSSYPLRLPFYYFPVVDESLTLPYLPHASEFLGISKELKRLFHAVGFAAFAGLAVIILTVLANTPLAKLHRKFQSRLMGAQDHRLTASNEALVNMQVFKLYAWDAHFKTVIASLRNVEYKWLFSLPIRKACTALRLTASPIMVSAALFDFGSVSLVVDVDDPYGFRLLVMGRSSHDVFVVRAKVGLLLAMSAQLVDFPFMLQVFGTNLECWQPTDFFQSTLFDPGISKHLLDANGLIDGRISVYFVHNRFSPNEYSFPAILKSCATFMGITEGRQVHGLVVKMGLLSDLYVQNSLVHFYSVCGECSDAGQVFDEMIVRDTVSWAGLVSGYVRAGLFDEALSLFSRMDAVPNVATFVSVLVACGRKGCLRVGKKIHGLIFRRALEENVEATNALMDMYVKCACLNDAKQIFDELPMKDVVSWPTIISGLVHCKRPKESLELFSDMQKLGIKPDGIILTSVLSACASLGTLDYERWVHHYIVRRGIQWDIHIGTAIIDMYAQCGCIELALQTFDGMRSKNVRTWNALLNGLAMHGHACEALRLFNEMVRLGMRPNEVTFLSILTACCHSGLVDEGRHYFHQMMSDEFQLSPRLEHYGCMVDMLCTAGLLDEALKLIKGMDMEPDMLIIGTVLSACKVNEIGELSQEILDQLVELDSHDSGVHVLLSNVSPPYGGLTLCEAATSWRDGLQVQLTGFHSDYKSEHADFVLRQWLIPWDWCCAPNLNLADKIVLMGTVLLCTKEGRA